MASEMCKTLIYADTKEEWEEQNVIKIEREKNNVLLVVEKITTRIRSTAELTCKAVMGKYKKGGLESPRQNRPHRERE